MDDPAKEIKTVFCDIDGCIFKHFGGRCNINEINPSEDLLPGVKEAFSKWRHSGYRIVLTTGRPPSSFDITKQQLEECGLFYDDIVMGLPRGSRIVINDKKPDGQPTASGVNIPRDRGLGSVDI